MSLTWKAAILLALQNYSVKNSTVKVVRQKFIAEEMTNIIEKTGRSGKTPAQTISRVLQELRDEGILFFSSNSGEYILNNVKIDASAEDFPEDALENAIANDCLTLSDVETASAIAVSRIRMGVATLRKKTLLNYRSCCALCDIDDARLLVTSHIARWADNPEAQGLLSNTICFCTLHDKLFENGYFSFEDNFSVIWKETQKSKTIEIWKNSCTEKFKLPVYKNPSSVFIHQHRLRTGFVVGRV